MSLSLLLKNDSKDPEEILSGKPSNKYAALEIKLLEKFFSDLCIEGVTCGTMFTF